MTVASYVNQDQVQDQQAVALDLRLQIHVVSFISVNVNSALFCGNFKVANGNLAIALVFQ